jgi:uncharacterized peroxidase-related enzyme
MRLPEVERGDSLGHRLLIRMISRFAGYRLPDAARVAFYDRAFVGPALGAWTQKAMRGPSAWSVSQRELMAAMVASWNSCPFCVGAHSAIAIKGLDDAVVAAVLADYSSAPIEEGFRATLGFLEKMTRHPEQLSAADARVVLETGVSAQQLQDAAAVGAVFNVITRNANALDFQMPTPAEFAKAAGMLLRRGYG